MKYLDENGLNTVITEFKGLLADIDVLPGSTLKNYLYGKKVNFVGDSITIGANGAGDSATVVATPFPEGIAEKFHCTIHNYGIGASTLCDYQGEHGFPTNPMCNRISGIDRTADITVIFGGTNDCSYQAAIGYCSNGDNTTVIGALYQMITWIKTNCPNQQIVLCSPLRRANVSMAKVTGAYPLIDYVKAVESAAKRFGTNYINLYDGCPFDLSESHQNTVYGGDGLHPNQQGYNVLASYIGYKLATQSFDMPTGGAQTVLYNDAPPTAEENLPIYYGRCWKDYPMIEAACTAFGNVIYPVTFNTISGSTYVAPLRNYDGTLVGTCYFYASGANRGQIRYVPAATWGGNIRIIGYDI